MLSKHISSMRRINSYTMLAMALLLSLLGICHARAATYTWDGGGSDNNFTTAGNWAFDGAPDRNAGADLIFAGTTRLAPDANWGGWTVNSITFSNTAGAFTLTGGGLTIGAGGITNSSASTQTIQNQITLSANQTWNAASGAVIVNGYVGGNGKTLTLGGAHAITVNNQLNGLGTLNVTGSGNRTFNGYTSATTLNAGGTGTATYNAQVNVTTLNVTSGSHTFNETVNASTLYVSGGTATLAGSGSKNISSTIVENGYLIMAQTGGGDAINGSLVVKSGGTVEFQADNQIPHWTTVTLEQDSTLLLGDTSQTFANLIITGDCVIDFGEDGSQLNIQNWGNITIAEDITITIVNWDESKGDVFAGKDPGNTVVNIQYADSNGNVYATGTWGGGTITPGGAPVPEPATYGFIMLGSGIAFFAWRRWRTARQQARPTRSS